jgi:cytochrome c peroxidase
MKIRHFLVISAAVFATIGLAGCDRAAPLPAAQRDAEKIALGRELFLDRSLSADGAVSCADCHIPAKSFTDGRKVSLGVHGHAGTRNAPDLADAGVYSTLFWDGREHDLRVVALQAFTNPREMGLADVQMLLARINAQPRYAKYADGNRLDRSAVADGLTHYLRSLPRPPTRYDRSVEEPSLLDADERAGLALFTGKAACAECHQLTGSPATLTDQKFHHAGVGFEQIAGDVTALLDRLEQARRMHQPLGTLVLSEREIAESGRFAVTRRPADLGAFRTPSLRNVALTAPYMHDGSVATLDKAVEREIYYRSLGRGRAVNLTVTEQKQLTAFLRALSTEDQLAGTGAETSMSRVPSKEPPRLTSSR